MSPVCPAPDALLGTVLRISGFLECQARLLGENGFLALAGNLLSSGLIAALVTIFVAIIGYRLILGGAPGLRDGMGWTLRLGFVLALVTSWPAFQTLAYGVAVDGPNDLAGVMLPSLGLPGKSVNERAQLAYDTIRLGTTGGQEPAEAQARSAADRQTAQALARAHAFQFQPPLPKTAAAFLLSTTGVLGALRLAVGFLLAVGPIPILCLLFGATSGIFSGWIRALVGAALGALGAMIVGSIDLVMVEAELARLQTLGTAASADAIDAQALTSIVLLFSLVMLATVYFAIRVASAFSLPASQPRLHLLPEQLRAGLTTLMPPANASLNERRGSAGDDGGIGRITVIVDSLNGAVRRESGVLAAGDDGEGSRRRMAIADAMQRGQPGVGALPLGLAGKRGLGRKTRQARRRDQR